MEEEGWRKREGGGEDEDQHGPTAHRERNKKQEAQTRQASLN